MVNSHHGFRTPSSRKSRRGTSPARNTSFDGTNPPVGPKRLQTTTYGMRSLLSPRLDESQLRLPGAGHSPAVALSRIVTPTGGIILILSHWSVIPSLPENLTACCRFLLS